MFNINNSTKPNSNKSFAYIGIIKNTIVPNITPDNVLLVKAVVNAKVALLLFAMGCQSITVAADDEDPGMPSRIELQVSPVVQAATNAV